MPITAQNVLTLLALQLLAFGWRIMREINRRDEAPFPWVPVPDNVNLAAMVAVLYWCLLVPIMVPASDAFVLPMLARAIFAAATVLIVVYPIVVAAHYRLWDGAGRGINLRDEREHPYCTRQEAALQLIGLASAAAVFALVLRGNS